MKKKNYKVLYLLLFVSFFFIPSSFAIHRSTASETGTLGAAAWTTSLNQTGINGTLNVVPNSVNDTYTLNVHCEAEVDAVYSIIVSNIPSGVVVKLDDGSFQPYSSSITFSNSNMKILYTDVQKTKSHTLTFKANQGTSASTNNNVDIDVLIRQDLQ